MISCRLTLPKGHRDFVAVISALTEQGDRHVLAVLPDRLKASVVAWLLSIPEAIRERIITVCTDSWEGSISAVQEVLPYATIVIDRFHGARHYRDAVDELRKQEVRRLKNERPKAEQDDLKRTIWPFRKRAAARDEEEQARLDVLLTHSPPLQQAYTLREQLSTLFERARSTKGGLRRIGLWRRRVAKRGLRCFDAVLKLLDPWLDLIANYFITHQMRAVVEGLNTKRKLLKRHCDGLRNVARLFQRLRLDLAGYRLFSPWRATSPISRGIHVNS